MLFNRAFYVANVLSMQLASLWFSSIQFSNERPIWVTFGSRWHLIIWIWCLACYFLGYFLNHWQPISYIKKLGYFSPVLGAMTFKKSGNLACKMVMAPLHTQYKR